MLRPQLDRDSPGPVYNLDRL